MSKQVKIAKLCLEIGGKKIELTMKQARELKDVLNDSLGHETVKHVHHDYWRYPYTTFTTASDTILCGSVSASSNAGVAAYGNQATYTSDQFQGSIAGDTVTLTAQ